MSDLVRPSNGAMEAHITSRPMMPRRYERAMVEGVATNYAKAAVESARVQAVGYVTTAAMRALASLEDEEAAAVLRDPMNGGRRQRALVDSATMAFREAIENTGRRW